MDGEIDLEKPPSVQKLDRMIRAFYPWPAVWTKVNLRGNSKIVKFLPKGLIQMEGKKPMTLQEFTNGFPQLKSKLENIKLKQRQ